MFDSKIRPYIDPPLDVLGRVIARLGVSANMITGVGFIFSLCAFAALGLAAYLWALFFIVVSRLMDGLDGAVARNSGRGSSDLGGFLDIVTDMISYAGFAFFFAVGHPETAFVAAFLIFSFMGTSCSFLAYGIIAAKKNIHHERQGKKSFYYASGLCEGSETIFFFILICLFPDYFTPLSLIFGVLCWITTVGRVSQAIRNL